MIHYIFAAAFGALIGSQSKKSKKSYADGGLIVSWFDKDINYQSKRFDTKKMEDAKRFFHQKQSEYLKPTLTTYDNDVILDSTYAKGGKMFVPQGREILYQDENVALQHNKVSDHYSMINPDTGVYMAKGGEVVPNYLKGKKTEVTKILLNGETEDSKLELMLYKDGDLDDINRAEYYTGDYIDLDRLNNQIHKLVKTYNLEEVYLKFPHDIYEFDQIILWTKDKMEKGGKTDDLGNPTEPKILEKMEIFIKNEIPKLDKGRFFTDGMQRKEAKKRFYQRFEYGAYNPKFSFDFAKGGKTNTVSQQNTFRRITEDSLDPYFLFTQYGDDSYVDDNVTLLNGSADLQFKRTPKDFKPSPMSGLPYEIKKIIRYAGGFEYFSYGEMGGKKSVTLRDGSWGDFYIEFENVTLNEIKEVLLPLAETVKEDLEEKGIKGYGELGYNSYGNYLDLEISEDNEENYAKGGMTEHGLQLGDKIIGAGENSINVVTKKGGQKKVDLSEGTRESFAKGGKTLPRPAKDFIAYVIDMDGNATLKYSKTFQGANRMMKNLMKKIQDVSTHGISKYDPFYGTRVGKMFFEPIKGFAKGGMTEHGLEIGDKIIKEKDNAVLVVTKDEKNTSIVNLDKGIRANFEKGGKTNWIQEVVDSPDFRKGAFTKKAKERGLTPEEFMSKVLKNPDKYDERTRKQAQFMKNITD